MEVAVEARALGKRYRLGTDTSGYDTLREALTRRALRRSSFESEVWAVRDLDLTVGQGEALGIIGGNGAGKTTLLKILAGITEPTAGEARVRGRVGALLDVGTGFHPELTGRENVFLSASILGMGRADVLRLYDSIVEFADLERFVDTPVKRYSAGMRLRLAFAVAAHIQPAILVIDEILAVGDAEFRERCFGRIGEISEAGRTVLFVSHDLGAVTRLCDRAIWLDNGRVRAEGPASEVVATYLDASISGPTTFVRSDQLVGPLADVRLSVGQPGSRESRNVARGDEISVEGRFALREACTEFDLSIWLENRDGVRVIDDALSDHGEGPWDCEAGQYEFRLLIPGFLPPGEYGLGLWVGRSVGAHYEPFLNRELLRFAVMPRPDDRHEWGERRRVTQPALAWEFSRDSRGS